MFSAKLHFKRRSKWSNFWPVPALVLAQTFGFAQSAAAISFSDCGNGLACPYMTYGDAVSYSLMENATIWNASHGGGTGPGNPFYVPSNQTAIQNDIVVGTGQNETAVTTNYPGMDNAYPTPDDTTGGQVFFTTNKSAYGYPSTGFNGNGVSAPQDPAPTAGLFWDTSNTWDTSLSALTSYLGTGNTPVFFFNNDQVNTGAATNHTLAIWAQIVVTSSTGAPTQYFDFTNNLSPYTEPGGGIPSVVNPAAYLNYSSTGSGPVAGDNTSTDYVQLGGGLCLNASFNAQACDGTQAYTINNNLGANQAAYAIEFPELNALLNSPGISNYDALHIDWRMGCDPNTIGYSGAGGTPGSGSNCTGRSLNGGSEQLFITANTYTSVPESVPEPSTLALIGLGLVACGFSARKKAA